MEMARFALLTTLTIIIPKVDLCIRSSPRPSIVSSESAYSYKETPAVRSPAKFTGQCGHTKYWGVQTIGAGIAGGQEALANEFPWLVKTASESAVTCMGVVYASQAVLTAGHCCPTRESSHGVNVYLGGHGRTDNHTLHVYVPAKDVHRYHTFTDVFNSSNPRPVTHLNDMCVLKLKEKLSWSDAIRPICLPQSCVGTCQAGDVVVMAGWGYYHGTKLPDVLVKGRLIVVTNSECSGLGWYDTPMPDNVMCAGGVPGATEETQPCMGDSGGAAMCFKNGYFQVDGILAASEHGCTRSKNHVPAVFGRVCYPDLLDWARSFSE